MTTTRFFVYGHFCEGMQHYSKIQKFAQSVTRAKLKASAFRLKAGFPVLVESGDGFVPGEVIEVQSSDILLSLWDELFGYNQLRPEDSLYFRKQVEAQSEESSQNILAWVYFLNPKKLPLDAEIIPNGDWIQSLQDNPPMVSKLTERQVVYIKKLGQTTGREIVPIDLPLYRELMNLELIVDKGRRLALSKLGHEVYRNLE